MENTVVINNTVFNLSKLTKWTWEATSDESGAQVTTAPSRPKLISKLEKMFPESAEPEVIPTVEVPETVEPIKPKNTSAKTPKVKSPSMRNTTIAMMQDGKDDAFILSCVSVQHPEKKYDMTHVKWYRSTFAKSGLITPEFAPKGSKMYKEWLAEQQKDV